VRWAASEDVRPNQVFAAALAHGPVTGEQRRAVVRVAREHLLTSAGLRTLAPGGAGYRARFEGPIFERDGAYHQGTVWPWLIGAYSEAVCRAEGFSHEARREAADAVRAVARRITTDGGGQLWEVYDAEEPRRPDGCIAQAWSVAECLRGLMLAAGGER
jgi:glycogen debranching enzyme